MQPKNVNPIHAADKAFSEAFTGVNGRPADVIARSEDHNTEYGHEVMAVLYLYLHGEPSEDLDESDLLADVELFLDCQREVGIDVVEWLDYIEGYRDTQ